MAYRRPARNRQVTVRGRGGQSCRLRVWLHGRADVLGGGPRGHGKHDGGVGEAVRPRRHRR